MSIQQERGEYETGIIARYAAARQRLSGKAPKPVTGYIPDEAVLEEPRAYGAVVSLIGKPGWKTIVHLCALRHRVTFADIINKDQRHDVVRARNMAMALCVWHCDLSFTKAGMLFERDPTTVLSGVRRFHGEPRRPAKGELFG